MVDTTISHYEVLEKIGQGGMGEVYRADGADPLADVGGFLFQGVGASL